MSTTDGAIDKKLIYDLEWIYYCLPPKNINTNETAAINKIYSSLSAQIKQHNRYSKYNQ